MSKETMDGGPINEVPVREHVRARPLTKPLMPKGRPFEKGMSGNPMGRPKKLLELELAIRDKHCPAHVLQVLEKLRLAAMRGDIAAAKLFLDRVMGPVRLPIDVVLAAATAPDVDVR